MIFRDAGNTFIFLTRSLKGANSGVARKTPAAGKVE